MAIAVIRTFILYFAVMAGIRIMGKRQIGELEPSELVITIMLGNLAAVPMQETDISILNGIAPIITLVFIEVAISVITLKSKRARRIISGSPSVLIRDGEIDCGELKRLRLNMDDLTSALRNKDIVNIDDVYLAILDTTGDFCVVPKASKRPVTPQDLNISAEEEELPYTVVSDGKIITDNLKKIGRSEKWLLERLKKDKLLPENVLLAVCTKDGKLTIKKDDKKRSTP